MGPAHRRLVTRLAVLLAAGLTASLVSLGTAAAASPNLRNHVTNRHIVVAKSHADYEAMRADAIRAGATIEEELTATDTLVISGPASVTATLSADAHVQHVAVDHIERVVPPEATGANSPHTPGAARGDRHGDHRVNPDPAFSLPGLMWNVNRIGAPNAWRTSTGKPSVTVGVADTGLDFTHPELATQVAGVVDLTDPTLCTDYFGYSDADFAGLYGGPATTDWNGHGSWIGGNIAGALDGVGINGIAPNVKLVALKISEWCGYAYDSSILAAFQYAADHGINIVSISFGGYLDLSDPDQQAIYDQYVQTVAYARSKGTVIVAAAGNEHARIGAGGRVLSHGILWIPGDIPDPVTNPIDFFGWYETPGGIPGVVDVSATGNVVIGSSASCASGTFESGNATCKPASDAHQPTGVGRQNQLTYYSNYGPRIDVAAPGGARKFNVPSADRGGTAGWPVTTADGYTAYEDFSITSDWALEIPCYDGLSAPQFYAGHCYSTIQGTSMATPHASAVLALLASTHPWLAHNAGALVGMLKGGAQHVWGNTTPPLSATDTSAGDRTGLLCPTGYCHLGGPAIPDWEAYGAGLVNAASAVR
jgi:hypothetical protein